MLLKSSATLVVGEVAAKAIPFLMVPYLTNAFGAEIFLEYIVLESWLFGLILLIGVGQESLIVKDYVRRSETEYVDIIRASLLLQNTMLLACLLVAFFLVSQYKFLLIILIAALMARMQVYQTDLIASQKSREYVVSQFLNTSVLAFGTILIFELYKANIMSRISMFIVATTTVLFYLNSKVSFVSRASVQRPYSTQKLAYCLMVGAPLILHGGANFVRLRLDKVIIASTYDVQSAANYGVASVMLFTLNALIVTLFKAFTPPIYNQIKLGTLNTYLVRNVLLFTVVILIFVGIIPYLIPPAIWEWVFGIGFGGIGKIVSVGVISYSIFPIYLFLFNTALFYDKTKTIITASLLGSCIGALYLYTCSKLELGASWLPVSNFIGFFFTAVFLYYAIRKNFIKLSTKNNE